MLSAPGIRAAVLVVTLSIASHAMAAPVLVTGSVEANALSPASVAEYAVQLDLRVLENAERLLLTLPGGVFEAARVSVERQPHGVFWRGRIHGAWDVLITSHRGTASGVIYTPWQMYELLPDGDGLRLAELDAERFLPCLAEDPAPAAAPPVSAAGPIASSADPVTNMDILVVYTPQARTGAGGRAQIESVIQSAVNITNTAYINSQVDARLNLIHMAEAPFGDSGSSSTDLTTVRSDATVQGLRNTYGADMVGLIVDRNDACGRGYVQRNPGPGFESRAYQVTARGCAVGNLSFAHEFGHNQGCEHDPANGPSPSSAAFPFAFGHFQSGQYRTVMSYSNQCTSSCPRAPHFSNSNVQRSGLDTGILDQRENYRTINATARIVADFRPPAVIVNLSRTAYQISENAGRVNVQVGRSGRADVAVSVVVRAVGGQAQAGADFTDTATTVMWAAGSIAPQTVSIPILDDRRQEGDETFEVVLETPRGAGLGTSTVAVVTINDFEEGVLRLPAPAAEVREDEVGVTLQVQRIDGADGEVAVAYEAEPGTATPGADYSPFSGRLTWLDGDATSRQIVLPLVDDRLAEGPETVTVRLFDVEGGAELGPAETAVTIQDWEEGDLELVEPTATVREDAGQLVLTVRRVNGADGDVSADLTFTPPVSGAPAQPNADFRATPIPVTFADGTSGTATVTVTILDDQAQEGDERFAAVLSNPTNGARIGGGETTVTIIDREEGALAFDQSALATDESMPQVEVRVVRTGGADGEASIRVETAADSATPGDDFAPLADVLRWGDGDASPRTVIVDLLDDRQVEDDERFFIRLSSPTGARLGTPDTVPVALADFEPGLIELSPASVRVGEDQGQVVLQARRVQGSGGKIAAEYRLVPGTAETGADYTDEGQQVIGFADGEAGPIALPIALRDDLLPEGDETFQVQLVNPTGGAAVGAPVVITILDAGAGQVGPTEARYDAPEGTRELTVDVARTGEANGPLRVRYRTEPGSAVSPADYSAAAGLLQWADGQTGARTISIAIASDEDDEADETFELLLESDDPGVRLVGSTTITIIDDDDGGCGCAAAERGARPGPAWGLVLIAVLLGRRRGREG